MSMLQGIVLDNLTRERRKELNRAATELYKSGAEPNPDDLDPTRLSRAEIRRGMRALGMRGAKSAKKNPARTTRQVIAVGKQVAQASLIDDLLVTAKDRVEHPVRSRLGRR